MWTILFWTLAVVGIVTILLLLLGLCCEVYARVDRHLFHKEYLKEREKRKQEESRERERHQSAPVKVRYRDEWMIYVFEKEAFVYKGTDTETQQRLHLGKLVGTDLASTHRAAEKAIDQFCHKEEVCKIVYNTFCNYYGEHPGFVEDVIKAVLARPTHFSVYQLIEMDALADVINDACVKSPELFEELKVQFADDIKAANDERERE